MGKSGRSWLPRIIVGTTPDGRALAVPADTGCPDGRHTSCLNCPEEAGCRYDNPGYKWQAEQWEAKHAAREQERWTK